MSIPAPSSSTGSGTTSSASATTSSAPATTSSGTSASSPPFQIFGLATGLNTGAIIDKLTALYSAPMQLVQRQQAVTLQKQSAWNDIQSKLAALQTAVQNLQAPAAASGRVGTTTPPAGSATAPFTVSATAQAALGSFTVNVTSLATTAQLTGAAGIARQILAATTATTSPLGSEGLGTTPTTGTVTINGTAITIDSATTLLGGVGTDSVQAKINAIAGLSFSDATDGSGNVSSVTIASTTVPGTPIQLGAAGDTSNLLTALRLNTAIPVTAGGTYSVTSNGALAGINPNAALGSANLAGAFTTSGGTFYINGKAIAYTNTDTLNSLMATINGSQAGVTASYDALSDRLVLKANTTGTGGIAVTDPSATGLPTALHLMGVGSSMTAGLPAQLTISGLNGGNPIASASNTVAGIIPGVTLNLTGISSGGPTTVTIGQDSSALTTALQGFVTAYNTVQDTLTKYTAVQTAQDGTQQAGTLAGDPSLSGLATQLDNTVNDTTVTVNGQRYSLAALGISTGVPGTFGAGSTPTLDLQFNQQTAQSALTTTPGLAAAFIGNGAAASQTGTLFGALNTLVTNWVSPLGGVATSLNELSAEYTNQLTEINNWQTVIQQQHDLLVQQFSNMETSVSLLQAQGQALSAALSTLTTNNTSSSSKTG